MTTLATTCPACSTCFRVVQDQLKVSEGWVRCGHCQRVFNALEGLFELDAPAPRPPKPAPESPPPKAPPATAAPVTAVTESPGPVQQPEAPFAVEEPPGTWSASAPMPSATPDPGVIGVVFTGQSVDSVPAGQDGPDSRGGQPSASSSSASSSPPHDETTVTAAPVVDMPLAAPAQAPTPAPAGTAAPLRANEPAKPAGAPEPDGSPLAASAALPDFVRTAEQRARWERPGRRAVLSALSLLLGLGIVAQVAWHGRDRLAYAWPALRPMLALACQRLGCTLQPPRVIDALVVDNTTMLHPPGVEGYRLAVTLHNRADHPVAAPNLELALSDAQGDVVVKRVLQPADFKVPANAAIAPQSDVTWTLEFTARDPGRIAGYTVAAFYP